MPCDSIIRNSINFENAKGHEDILADALRELGYSAAQYDNGVIRFFGHGHSGTYANGQFNTTENRYSRKFDVDQVKQAFGRNTVKAACRKFGWTMKETEPNKFKITRRV